MKRGNVDIHIATDGSRTVVEAYLRTYLHKTVTAYGSSSRDPQDKTDRKIGEALAVARALRRIAAKLEREAHGTMKHREDCLRHAQEITVQRQNAAVIDELTDGSFAPVKIWK